MARPDTTLLPAYQQAYIKLVPENDIILAFDNQGRELGHFLDSIHESKAGFRYAPGKWTVAQSLQHVIDTERIFAYRALALARGEKQHLPGFEQDEFATLGTADHRTILDLREEFLAVRRSTCLLVRSFTQADWSRTGTVSGKPISVLAIGYILVGHLYHHMAQLKEKYQIA